MTQEASLFKAVNLVKEFEGFSAKPYLCPAKKLTIGYGRTEGVKWGDTTTEEKEETYVIDKLMAIQKQLKTLVKVPVSGNQNAALLDFCYNLGIGNFSESTLRILLNKAEYYEAAKQFERWIYAGKEVLPGLVKRRAKEANLFCTP